MGAFAEAMRQDLPDVSDARAEFAVDGIPYVTPLAPKHDPTAPANAGAQNAVPDKSDAEIETAKLFEKGLFTAVDVMDNNELSAVYQGLVSGQANTLKRELHRIMTHPETKASVRDMAERSFADLEQNGAPAAEITAAQNLRDELSAELAAAEREQTANLSDQDIVDLVENVIRSSPKDFPLLAKYYLNAEPEPEFRGVTIRRVACKQGEGQFQKEMQT